MNFKKYGMGFNIEKKFKILYGLNTRITSNFLKIKIKRLFKQKTPGLLLGRSLFQATRNNINFYKDIKNYRGIRHRNKYPVRGQRTHTNAKQKKFKQKFFL